MAVNHSTRIEALKWVKCALESEMKDMYPKAINLVAYLIDEERIENNEEILAQDHHQGE